jgi:uncharacterized protein with HEPN domain
MKRPVKLRVRDALEAMRTADSFIGQMSAQEFASDLKTLYAVEYCFIIIGEALRHVPDEVRAAYPDVPWRDIAGMRNRIAHDYLYTDRELIWETVRTDFPPVVTLLERVLADLDAEDEAAR